MKKYILTTLLGAGFLAAAGAANASDTDNKPVLFQATFSTTTVVHSLFQPGATDVAHPFYTKQCAASPASTDFSKAGGTGVFSFDPKTHTLKYAITFMGLSGVPLMAHFHLGAAGQEGPIVQTLCGQPPANSVALGSSAKALDGSVCPKENYGFISGSYKLNGNKALKMTEAQEVQALMDDKLYINFHTCLNEAGEIRGQVVKVS